MRRNRGRDRGRNHGRLHERDHGPSVPALYQSVITHVRTKPGRYAFKHRTYLWLVDLDRLPVLPRPLRPLARFDGRDHFAGRDGDVRAGLERFLAEQGVGVEVDAGAGVDLDGGQVLMLGNARVFGHVFNPLTLFWCHDREGVLRLVVAEVHNTYGERHCYLLRPDRPPHPDHQPPRPDAEQRAAPQEFGVAKDFYVSPFFAVAGEYRMRLPVPGERLALTVHLEQDGGRPFTATVHGRRGPATPWRLLRSLLRHPWPTLAVSLAIRWHGVRLWLRRLPVQVRPHHHPQKGMQ